MISDFIYSLNPIYLTLLVMFLTVSTSALCALFCRRFAATDRSDETQFKIETYSDAFGVAFAILLGLIIVTAWSSYDQTDTLVKDEVNSLNDLYNLANYLEDKEKNQIRHDLKEYVQHVIKDEWPLLPLGKYTKETDGYMFRILDILLNYNIKNRKEELSQNKAIKIVSQLEKNRRLRLINAQSSLTPLMWMILIGCNILTFIILGTAVKGHIKFHLFLQILYGIGTGLMILLVVVLDHPFYYGIYYDGGISSDQFKELLHLWENNIKI